MNDRFIALKLLVERGANHLPEVFWSWPVRDPINRAAIAKHDGSIASVGCGLELALNIENGALSRAAENNPRSTGKATAENDARGLRQHVDVAAEVLMDESEQSGLARSRPAGEDDSSALVRGATMTVLHRRRPFLMAPHTCRSPMMSLHQKQSHHPALGVLEDVTVHHPRSAVERNEPDVDALAGAHQHRVAKKKARR